MLLFVCCVEMNEKLLFEVVERGDIQLVTRFLDVGVDINGCYCGVCILSYNVCIEC